MGVVLNLKQLEMIKKIILKTVIYFFVVSILNIAWWLVINDFIVSGSPNYYEIIFGNDRFLVFYILVFWEIVTAVSKTDSLKT